MARRLKPLQLLQIFRRRERITVQDPIKPRPSNKERSKEHKREDNQRPCRHVNKLQKPVFRLEQSVTIGSARDADHTATVHADSSQKACTQAVIND